MSYIHRKSRHARALFVMDGHSSRKCPVTLNLLRRNGIDGLILPTHTIHIPQMFDVGLATILKKYFVKKHAEDDKRITND